MHREHKELKAVLVLRVMMEHKVLKDIKDKQELTQDKVHKVM